MKKAFEKVSEKGERIQGRGQPRAGEGIYRRSRRHCHRGGMTREFSKKENS